VTLGASLRKSGIMQTKKSEVQNNVCRRLIKKSVAFTLMGKVGK
jgi:hypothetical protein